MKFSDTIPQSRLGGLMPRWQFIFALPGSFGSKLLRDAVLGESEGAEGHRKIGPMSGNH